MITTRSLPSAKPSAVRTWQAIPTATTAPHGRLRAIGSRLCGTDSTGGQTPPVTALAAPVPRVVRQASLVAPVGGRSTKPRPGLAAMKCSEFSFVPHVVQPLGATTRQLSARIASRSAAYSASVNLSVRLDISRLRASRFDKQTLAYGLCRVNHWFMEAA